MNTENLILLKKIYLTNIIFLIISPMFYTFFFLSKIDFLESVFLLLTIVSYIVSLILTFLWIKNTKNGNYLWLVFNFLAGTIAAILFYLLVINKQHNPISE
ncbi:MAG: hypothetical protein KatS3mg027_1137 [Bacteroidia bacterium]|nr:MAG: hypothetical protein KatS3mg027_1137 [Bacteroidia bacterium]